MGGYIPQPETPVSPTPKFEGQKVFDLTGSTKDAEDEWAEIQAAFVTFRANLGPDFEPFPEGYMPPSSSPFGATLYFRTYPIAIIWAMYYTGLMILNRCRPSMPAEIHMATGIAAPMNREYANAIGQIACGVSSASSTAGEEVGLNPGIGAASIELTIPLFFAGIQYMDPAQRIWTAAKLRETARATGWDSARLVAVGCELSWCRMHEMGRGPPYQIPEEAKAINLEDERETRVGPVGSTEEIVDLDEADGSLTLGKHGRVHYAVGVLGMPSTLR
jgi:hypothetical protein